MEGRQIQSNDIDLVYDTNLFNEILSIILEDGDIGRLDGKNITLNTLCLVSYKDGSAKSLINFAAEKNKQKLLDYFFEKIVIKFYCGKEDIIDLDKKDHRDSTLFDWAVLCNQPDMVEMLIVLGVNINIFNRDKKTPLMIAASFAYIKVVNVLLEKGAKVNVFDSEGMSVLMHAANSGCVEVVNGLLKKGVKLNYDPSQYHLGQSYYRYKRALHVAAVRGDVAIANALIQAGAEIDAHHPTYYPSTPLVIAAELGHIELVRLLVQQGANINFPSISHKTAIMLAAKEGHLEVVKFLLDNGAKLEESDGYGRTPLCFAALNGREQLVHFLLEKGANTEVVCSGLYTSTARLLYCVVNEIYRHSSTAFERYAAIIADLIAHGADRNYHPQGQPTIFELAKNDPALLAYLRTLEEEFLEKIIVENKAFIQLLLSPSIDKNLAISVERNNQTTEAYNLFQYLYDLLGELKSLYEMDFKPKPYYEIYFQHLAEILALQAEVSEETVRSLDSEEIAKACDMILTLSQLNQNLYSKYQQTPEGEYKAKYVASVSLLEEYVIADEQDISTEPIKKEKEKGKEKVKAKEKESDEKRETEKNEEVLCDIEGFAQLSARQAELILEHRWRQEIDVSELDKDKPSQELLNEIRELIQQRVFIPSTFNDKHRSKIMTLVLNDNSLGYHRFEIADQLLKQGIALPEPKYKRENFETITNYFDKLFQNGNESELYLTLRSIEEFATLKDKKGNTPFHCYMMYAYRERYGDDSYRLLLQTLDVTINIKNMYGNTPLHLAASFRHFTEELLMRAIKLKFNFFDKNNYGESTLEHLKELAFINAREIKIIDDYHKDIFNSIFDMQKLKFEINQIDAILIHLIFMILKSGIQKYLKRKGAHHTSLQQGLAYFSFLNKALDEKVGENRANAYLDLLGRHHDDLHQLIILQALLANPYTEKLRDDVVEEFKSFGGKALTFNHLTNVIGRMIYLLAVRDKVCIVEIKQMVKQIVDAVENQTHANLVISFEVNTKNAGLPRRPAGSSQ